MKRHLAAISLVTAGLVAGGAAGVVLGIPGVSGAQTSTATPSAGSDSSNTDPAHEAAESPEQASAEANGTFHGGPGGGHSNTDAAHEAAESPERAAAEAAHDAQVTTSGTN